MRYLILTLLFMIAFSGQLYALEAGAPQQLFDFASTLYDSRNYYGAVLEFQRLLSYYPGSSLTKEASFMIGMSYYRAGKVEEAAQAFDFFISTYPKSDKAKDALINIAEGYYKNRKYLAGIHKLNEIKTRHNPGELSATSEYLMGWGYLGKQLFPESSSIFYYLSTRESEYRTEADELYRYLKLAEKLPEKSPLLAGVLSAIIPGSGQIYSERFYDGLVSFFLNAAFIYLASEGYRTGNNSTGLFFSVIELGWYTGNIYSAVGSAHKYNEEKRDEFVNSLKIKYGFQF